MHVKEEHDTKCAYLKTISDYGVVSGAKQQQVRNSVLHVLNISFLFQTFFLLFCSFFSSFSPFSLCIFILIFTLNNPRVIFVTCDKEMFFSLALNCSSIWYLKDRIILCVFHLKSNGIIIFVSFIEHAISSKKHFIHCKEGKSSRFFLVNRDNFGLICCRRR